MSAPAGEARQRLREARRLIERIAKQRPALVELAESASFAVRVDPALLRRLRLRFFPQSAASLEADLWHSELVHVRSPDGFTLTPWVAAALRERLAAIHRERYEIAWKITGAAHRALPETLLVEEELNYLERATRPGARKRATVILQRAIATVIGSDDSWVAAWGAGAASRATAGIELGDERRLLSVAASTRLGSTTPTLRPGDDWLSWAAGAGVERVPYRVRMGTNWLELRPVGEASESASAEEAYDAASSGASEMTVMLPRTSPMVVEVSWVTTKYGMRLRKPPPPDENPWLNILAEETLEPEVQVSESRQRRDVELRAIGPTVVRVGATVIVLRTLLGDEYAIGPRPGREAWTIPAPLPNQIGYERQLEEVVRRLLDAEGIPVVVEGPAGAGRRQFGLRVAAELKKHVNRFERAILIRPRDGATSERSLLSSMLKRLVAESRGSVDSLRAKLAEVTLEQKTLIVIDSSSRTVPVERMRVGSKSALLVLRRWSDIPENITSDAVRIADLEPQQALQLFMSSLGSGGRSIPSATAHAIVEACDFLPVPIVEVARLAATLRDEEITRLPAMIRGSVRLAVIPHAFGGDTAREMLGEDEPDENAYETRAS